jgi:hypothetical protein
MWFALLLCLTAADREVTVDGTVKSYDPKTMTLVIDRGGGKETTVTLDKNTEVRRDGKPAKTDELIAGRECRCAFWLDKKVATWAGVWVDIDRPPLRR